MPKICFASPPLTLEARYGALAPFGSTMPSLALLSLAAVSRKEGFESQIIPSDSLNFSYMLPRLEEDFTAT